MRIHNNYMPISKQEAGRLIRQTTGIEPVWAVPTWSADRGAWSVMCCAVPGAPDGRLAVAIYQNFALYQRINVIN